MTHAKEQTMTPLRARMIEDMKLAGLTLCDIGNYGEYFVTFDGAVYDGVRHVDAPWPELSSERLAHHPQARLRSGERGECRLPAQRGRRAGKEDRPPAARQHAARDLAPEHEAAETSARW
jgi:hypothetical protein